jgi:hypothetical protein
VTAERNEAFALIRDDYARYVGSSEIDPDADESTASKRTQDRRRMVKELVGEGYNFSNSERTFQRHKALALAQLKQIAGPDNTLRQQQLAESLLGHYRAGNEEKVEPGSVDYTAHVAVIDGVVEALRMLKNGTHPPQRPLQHSLQHSLRHSLQHSPTAALIAAQQLQQSSATAAATKEAVHEELSTKAVLGEPQKPIAHTLFVTLVDWWCLSERIAYPVCFH